MNKATFDTIGMEMLELRRDVENHLQSAEQTRMELQQIIESLALEKEQLELAASQAQAEATEAGLEVTTIRTELVDARNHSAELELQLSQARRSVSELSWIREELALNRENAKDLERLLKKAYADIAELASYASDIEAELRDVLASRSWKITRFVRGFNVLVQRLMFRRQIKQGVKEPARPASLERWLTTDAPQVVSVHEQITKSAPLRAQDIALSDDEARQLQGQGRTAGTGTEIIQRPVDFHRLAREGQLLPRFGKLAANRTFPSGFPFELLLPAAVGNKNDYGFLLDAVNQLGCTGDIPSCRIAVVATLRDQQDIERLGRSLSQQTLPRECFDITLFLDGTYEGNKITWADRTFNGTPWRISRDQQPDSFGENVDILLFLDGVTYADCQLLERVARYSALSPNVVLGLAEISDDPTGIPGLYSNTATARDWRKERFPFRNVQSLNFAIPASLFKEAGGFDSRFYDYRKAVMELGFRAYNLGAYFIPLGVAHQGEMASEPLLIPEDLRALDDQLFESLCPVHWYRREEGRHEVPKVSIYIPAYNAAEFICTAIDSVLDQDFEDLEVCVHVDGSPDHTLQVLEQNYGNNNRVHWSIDSNAGIGHASNRAIGLARGMYIGQLDSDDRLKPGAIRALVEVLDENGDIGCAYSSCERIDARGKYSKDEYSWPVFSHEKMMLTSIVHHFRLFRRQAWERTERFRESIRNAVDYDMFLKLSEVTKLHHVDRSLYQRRWHGGNTSSVNEGLQTQNTHIVQNLALERQGLGEKWQVKVPDENQPRRITFARSRKHRRLIFWPDYSRSNAYQSLLYRNSLDSCDFYSGDIEAAIKAARDADDPENLVFHVHWLNPLVQNSGSQGELRRELDTFIGQVKEFKSLGGSVIWTLHNCVSHDAENAEIEREFSSVLADTVDRIHVHAQSSLSEIEADFNVPRDKVVVSPHGSYQGVYPNYIPREVARRLLGLGEGERAVLFFGQIRPYKGLESLFESCADLIGRGQQLRLIIAGSASYDIRGQLKGLGVPVSQVKLIDRHIDDAEIQVLFNAADVAVFPYRRILTSGSLMLALTFGLPAIIPAVGMTREVLDGNEAGILYAPDEPFQTLPEALGEALRLMDEGGWQHYRDNAARLSNEHGWPDFIADVFGAEIGETDNADAAAADSVSSNA